MGSCFEVERRGGVGFFGPLGYGEGVGEDCARGEGYGWDGVDLGAGGGDGWWGGAGWD
jgi:hypothetical protein